MDCSEGFADRVCMIRITECAASTGLVPTPVEPGERPVYESLVCVEYVDELGSSAPSLLPGYPGAEKRAKLYRAVGKGHARTSELANLRCGGLKSEAVGFNRRRKTH